MRLLFVTGSNAPFFNSLLVCLQSFAERLPHHRLLVCDFGLDGAQAEFLRGLGALLERPPGLASSGVFHCKAALLRYLRHSGRNIDDGDAIVWLDADLTLMDVGSTDFAAVAAAMAQAGAAVAACRAPADASLGQVVSSLGGKVAPFAKLLAATPLDASLPYFSTGVVLCRSAAFMQEWDALTMAVEPHPLFEQNMFNVALHRDRFAYLALDCEEWQAQGAALDRVRLLEDGCGVHAAACIGAKNIKTLHATSSGQGHLLIATCRMTVRSLALVGSFKLFLAEPLRMHQLRLLASFIAVHGNELLRLGICGRAEAPADGFEFVTL